MAPRSARIQCACLSTLSQRWYHTLTHQISRWMTCSRLALVPIVSAWSGRTRASESGPRLCWLRALVGVLLFDPQTSSFQCRRVWTCMCGYGLSQQAGAFVAQVFLCSSLL